MINFLEFILNEYGEDYKLRLVKTMNQGRYTAKIYKDTVYELYLARYYLDNKYLGEGPEREERYNDKNNHKEALEELIKGVEFDLNDMVERKYKQKK
jgi:hypothetical protein